MRTNALKAIKIIHVDRQLKRKFSSELMLNTDAPIVVVVGPNNSGKTAVLRLLATSLEFFRYYRTNGISKFWEVDSGRIPKNVIARLREVQEMPEGWFQFTESIKSFEIMCTRIGIPIDIRKYLRKFENPLLPPTGSLVLERRYPEIHYTVFWAINAEGRELVLSLEKKLKESTDQNVWGFVKPTIAIGGEIFTQYLGLQKEHDSLHEERERSKLQSEFRNNGGPFSDWQSPGLAQNEHLKCFLKSIRAFFRKHRNPIWEKKDFSREGRFRFRESFLEEGEKFEKVSRGARLCVFMDEPTIYLDPVNRLKFIEQILKLIEQFPGRVQFFIATNDDLYPYLQTHAVYIDLYPKSPVSSTSPEYRSMYLDVKGV